MVIMHEYGPKDIILFLLLQFVNHKYPIEAAIYFLKIFFFKVLLKLQKQLTL